MHKGIWVFAEQVKGEPKEASLNLLSEAKKLAIKAGETLTAVLFGHNIYGQTEKLAHYGADSVLMAEHERLDRYNAEIFIDILSDNINHYHPSILLFTATSTGRDLAPKIATKIKSGLVSNCSALDINTEKKLVMIKPIFGGKLSLKALCPEKRPQLATILPEALEIGNPDSSKVAEVTRIEMKSNTQQDKIKITGFIKGDPRTIDITDAEVLVCVGGGLRDVRNLKIVEEFAELLGAAIGGSRVAVDKGWIHFAHQVGQTGKTVCPKLIMTFGISGAIQFTMGMKNSRIIIANNLDKNAPIFKLADIGIVGDLNEIIPALTDKLRQVSKGNINEPEV